jgi:predicted ATPase
MSFHHCSVSFKPLTILVGANGSGKTNFVFTLSALKRMILANSFPPESFDLVWAGDSQGKTTFEIQMQLDENHVTYRLELQAHSNTPICVEKLYVNDVGVISVENNDENGRGVIKDENGKNPIQYFPEGLALNSAYKYGSKPVTRAFVETIKSWNFFDLQPSKIRGNLSNFDGRMESDGSGLKKILSNFYDTDREIFNSIRENVEVFTKGIKIVDENGQLSLDEGYEKTIPLKFASDGTVSFLAYQALLNQTQISPLIVIEEPEKHFHPAAFVKLGRLLEELAQKTQVIITTHSSHLLNSLTKDSLGDTLAIFLLRNERGWGTQVINVEQEQNHNEALLGWIEDFGIGSAIFNSGIMEE